MVVQVEWFVQSSAFTALGSSRNGGSFAILVGVASWYAWHVVEHSGGRRGNEPYWPLVSELEYPTGSVILTVGLMVVEVLLVDLLLHYRAHRELWRRALLGGVGMLPVSVFALSMVMDAPPYHGIHLLWLVALNVILVGLAVVSGFAHLARVVFEQR